MAAIEDANESRLAAFRKNRKGADGVRWLATLDTLVCGQCAALDGQRWDFDGKPIQGNTVAFMIPPAHENCRCVISYLPSSLDAILGTTGLDDMIAERNTRASQFGMVTGDTSMESFLKRLQKDQQDEILGKGRADLWRTGEVVLRELISDTGQLLSLDELANLIESRKRPSRLGAIARAFRKGLLLAGRRL